MSLLDLLPRDDVAGVLGLLSTCRRLLRRSLLLTSRSGSRGLLLLTRLLVVACASADERSHGRLSSRRRMETSGRTSLVQSAAVAAVVLVVRRRCLLRGCVGLLLLVRAVGDVARVLLLALLRDRRTSTALLRSRGCTGNGTQKDSETSGTTITVVHEPTIQPNSLLYAHLSLVAFHSPTVSARPLRACTRRQHALRWTACSD